MREYIARCFQVIDEALLPFMLPVVAGKKIIAAFDGGNSGSRGEELVGFCR